MSDNKWLPVVGQECSVHYRDGTLYIIKMLVTHIGERLLVGRILSTRSEVSLTRNNWDFKPIAPLKSETIEQPNTKFKVGDVIKHKSGTLEFTILFIDKISAGVQHADGGGRHFINLTNIEQYERVVPIRERLLDILNGLDLYSDWGIADMILEEFDVKEKS